MQKQGGNKTSRGNNYELVDIKKQVLLAWVCICYIQIENFNCKGGTEFDRHDLLR